MESAAVDILASIDCLSRTIDGIEDEDAPWTEIRESWREIGLVLVTAARFRFDHEMFGHRIDSLANFVNDHANIHHRIRHERCLWALYAMDFLSLSALVEDWNVDDDDPFWMIRKAAMLWELDRNREAAELVQWSLTKIRSQDPLGANIASASREGWALLSAVNTDNESVTRNRWVELARLKCDALTEKEQIKNDLEGRIDRDEAPEFDLVRTRSTRIQFTGGNLSASLQAYRAIRLSEVAGLPRVTDHGTFIPMAVAGDILKMAADDLASNNVELAIRLILRSCTYDEDAVLKRVLSRARVARLSDSDADALAGDCFRLIDYGTRQNWPDRIRVGMEVLSRLVLRMNPAAVPDVFTRSMDYYANQQDRVATHPWLSKALGNLLSRSWRALPASERAARVLDVMAAAMVGVDGFQDSAFSWHPDPGRLLTSIIEPALPERDGQNESKWQDFTRLVVRGLETGGEARRRAATRYVGVAFQDRLTSTEISQIVNALWADDHTPPDGLPGNTDLHDWVFLVLPEPEIGMANSRFRMKWMSSDLGDVQFRVPDTDGMISIAFGDESRVPGRVEDTLWNIGAALNGLKERGHTFEINDQERDYIIQLVELWVDREAELPPFPLLDEEFHRSNLWAIDGLASILWEVEFPEPLADRLFEKVKRLAEAGTPGFELIGALVQIMPDRTEELVTWLRRGLASGRDDMVKSSLEGLGFWIRRAIEADPSFHKPQPDLIREIGLAIAVRRKEALAPALSIAKLVFDSGSVEFREAILEYVTQGLDYLASELDYAHDHDDVDQVPLLRLRCARLAVSMARSGLRSNRVVDQWLKIAASDPLPEVRYSANEETTDE